MPIRRRVFSLGSRVFEAVSGDRRTRKSVGGVKRGHRLAGHRGLVLGGNGTFNGRIGFGNLRNRRVAKTN